MLQRWPSCLSSQRPGPCPVWTSALAVQQELCGHRLSVILSAAELRTGGSGAPALRQYGQVYSDCHGHHGHDMAAGPAKPCFVRHEAGPFLVVGNGCAPMNAS